jgi:hypothetical protein
MVDGSILMSSISTFSGVSSFLPRFARTTPLLFAKKTWGVCPKIITLLINKIIYKS